MAGIGDAHLRQSGAVLTARDVVVRYRLGNGKRFEAVSHVDLDLLPGETLGLVGESGCGKSTLARAIAALPAPDEGIVDFDGTRLSHLRGRARRQARATIGMVFQDPVSSLNPRRSIRQSVVDPLRVWRRGTRAERRSKVDALLRAVGLDPARADRGMPRQLSGGQAQRVSIARALVLDPDLLICDEPVSALDVSVQAGVLNLLEKLKADRGVSMIFVSHDLAVVKNISDRVAVMYLGRLCEVAPSESIYREVAHPFTAALMSSIPSTRRAASPEAVVAPAGDPPSPVAPPPGCRFSTRCPRAQDRCRTDVPVMRPLVGNPEHFVACHFPLVPAAEPVAAVAETAS